MTFRNALQILSFKVKLPSITVLFLDGSQIKEPKIYFCTLYIVFERKSVAAV